MSDPGICLLALQYSILDHKQALDKTFPMLDKRGISAVIGAPLNGGFLAGRNRFNYSPKIPGPMQQKFNAISDIALNMGLILKQLHCSLQRRLQRYPQLFLGHARRSKLKLM